MLRTFLLLLPVSILLHLATTPLVLAAPPLALTAPIFMDSGQELESIRSNTSRDVALGDIDGDGDVDALVAQGSFGSAEENVLWINDGNGMFREDSQFVGSGDSRSVALGDLDGDGDLDAIIANAGSGISNDDEIWINRGGTQAGVTGTFTVTQNLANGESFLVKLGDLDGAGDLDALTAGAEQQQIWWNDGSGSVSAGPMLNYPLPNDMALGDLDKDGDLDVVFAGDGDLSSSQIVWNDWNTGATFTPGPTLPTGGDNSAIEIADLDADTSLDIYIATSQADVIWWNNGNGSFSAGAGIGTQNDADVALGALDGNGTVDAFVVRRVGNNANGVWLNNGNRSFSASEDQVGNAVSFRAALADLDADGDLDAFVANGGPNKVWLNMTRSSTLERTRPFSFNGQALQEASIHSIALGDFTGDGLVDVFATGFHGTRTWFNEGGDQRMDTFWKHNDWMAKLGTQWRWGTWITMAIWTLSFPTPVETCPSASGSTL